MTVVNATGNFTVQQTITVPNTTYILEGGSISLNLAGPALAVDAAATSSVVILWNSLIENALAGGLGIQTDTFLRVELGDQSSIRTTGRAIDSSALGDLTSSTTAPSHRVRPRSPLQPQPTAASSTSG